MVESVALIALTVVIVALVAERAIVTRAALPYLVPMLRGVAKMRDAQAASVMREQPRPAAPIAQAPTPEEIEAAEAVMEIARVEDQRIGQMPEGEDRDAANEKLSEYLTAHQAEIAVLKRAGRLP